MQMRNNPLTMRKGEEMKNETLIKVHINLESSPLYRKTAIATIDDMEITDNEILYENIDLYVKNSSFEPTVVNFAGHKLTKSDAAMQMISAYMRDDKSYDYQYVHPAIKNMKKKQKMITIENKTFFKELYQFNDWIEKYELDVVSKNDTGLYKYYTTDSPNYMLLDPDNMITTDMEPFFESALADDYETKSIIYHDPEKIDLDAWFGE